MQAKDTVMSDEFLALWKKFISEQAGSPQELQPSEIAESQAEFSFRAGYLEGNKDTHAIATKTIEEKFEAGRTEGIREVVKWMEENNEAPQLYGLRIQVSVQELQAQLREWGIEEVKDG